MTLALPPSAEFTGNTSCNREFLCFFIKDTHSEKAP